MRQPRNIWTTTMLAFLIMVFWALTLSSIAGAEEEIDHLQPCPNPMMGFSLISEYYDELNKLLLGKSGFTDMAMVTLPSFSEESAVMVYRDRDEGDVVVEYVRPDKFIWGVLQMNRDSKRYGSFKFTPLDTIKIISHKRGLSKKTGETLEKVWRHMIEEAHLENMDNMFSMIDGTTYYFFYKGVVCGSYPQANGGATVNEFLKLAESLEHYAKSGEDSGVTEESILERAQSLLKKLNKK